MEYVRLFWLVFVSCMMMCSMASGGQSCRKLGDTLSDKLLDMLVAIKSGEKKEDSAIIEERPAFSLTLAKNPAKISGLGTILKLDNVILNRGNGYSTSTGQFTAPLDGLYQFSATIMSHSGGDLGMGIYRNGKQIMRMYGAKIHGATETANPVLELAKGDTIDVRHESSATQEVIGGHYSFMSGFFIGK